MLARRDNVQSLRVRSEAAANDQDKVVAVNVPPQTSAEVMRRISWRQLGLLLLLVVGMAGAFRLLGAWLFRP